jgi:hypothetical protein
MIMHPDQFCDFQKIENQNRIGNAPENPLDFCEKEIRITAEAGADMEQYGVNGFHDQGDLFFSK